MPVKFKKCTGKCGQAKMLHEFWSDSKQADGKMARCIECTRAARQERAEARANGQELETISPEERERRSQRMLALHAEGRAGPEYGRLGGRPKKERLSDGILEQARGKQDLIWRAIESNLRSTNKSHRMRAVEFLHKLEESEDQRIRMARGNNKPPDEMTVEELQEFVEQALTAKFESGELDVSSFVTLDASAIQEMTGSELEPAA